MLDLKVGSNYCYLGANLHPSLYHIAYVTLSESLAFKVMLKIRHDLSFFKENSSAGLFKEDLAFRATLSAKRSSLLEKQAAANLPRDVKFAYRGVCLLKPASTADHLVDKRVTTDHLVST